MSDFINGCLNSQLEVYDTLNELIETIVFPLADKDGLIEDPQPETEDYDYYDGEQDPDIIGFRLRWELSLKRQTQKAISLAIGRIFEYQKKKYKLIFTPRLDPTCKDRKYIVNLKNKNMPFGILRGGKKSRGNKGMFLIFETKWLVETPGFKDPDVINEIGFETDQGNLGIIN